MFKIKSATRLAISIGIACATLVWLAIGIGLIPDPDRIQIQNRVDLTKSIAVTVASFAESKRNADLERILERTVQADQNIVSIGIKRFQKSRYLLTAGPHLQAWNPGLAQDPGRQITVEVLANNSIWGQMEISFVPIRKPGLAALFGFPFGLVAFITSSIVLIAWFVLGKTFKYLNPSSVVPDRVRSALDTLAEGLVLTDPSGEIAHANQAFLSIMRLQDHEVLGLKLDEFGWTNSEASDNSQFPWHHCWEEKTRVCGEVIQLTSPGHPTRQFVINATPIHGANGQSRGVLVSFDDVTVMENKNQELAKMIQTLRSSRDEVARQNEQLNFLASYDPLTKCMNRRAFFSRFEQHWAEAADGELAVMMLDVDHFKAVNDNNGHSVGDEVLKEMGRLLRDIVAQNGLVCRYGGEEFVILIPDVGFDDSMRLAEKIRHRIEMTEAAGIRFTASIGVSSRKFGSMDAQHMLDQADESLYTAKRSGRNRVVRFDERENYDEFEVKEEPNTQNTDEEISYSAVTGLLSALSFRCQTTAEHSIRVADLCVSIGESMMNKRDVYRLEIAALLHDIGKIGVPDSILHKPGPLTPEEWTTMRKHDAIGVEIVRSALASETIAEAIESHHHCFSKRHQGIPANIGEKPLSLISRIITACDAFDAMVNDRVYRKAMSVSEAICEIQNHTPAQFDPEVVAHLVQHIESGFVQKPAAVNSVSTTRSAVTIGQHIKDLCSAVEDEDVERLSRIVNQLKKDSEETANVVEAAHRLDEAIQMRDKDMDNVLTLAKEVMDVCRATRATFVEGSELIVNSLTQTAVEN